MDDLKIDKKITNNIDLLHLRIDPANVEKWIKVDGLDFNDAKFKSIVFTPKTHITNDISSHNQRIEQVNQIRDLGIIFESALTSI